MSAISSVGPQAIPVEAGDPQAPLPDPVAVALADYFGFWIKFALDAKIATMTAPLVADVCPAANRFPINPEKLIVKFAKPALFVWWDGKSASQEYSVAYNLRQRDFNALYVYDALHDVAQVTTYGGLIAAVDGALVRACQRYAHPSYSYGGFGPGTNMRTVLNMEGWEYLGGQEGYLAELASTNIRDSNGGPRGTKGPIQRGYPALRATVRVWERVGIDTMLDPDNVTRDILTTIKTSDGDGEPVELLQGYLAAPDGSEQEDGS